MAVANRLTIEDYEALPAALARGHELVKGELVEVSGNIGEHNQLRGLIQRVLAEYLEDHKLGGLVISEQGYRFDEETTRAPDVSYFSEAKKHLYNRKRRVQLFVPDLAIEIASPNDRFGLVIEKIDEAGFVLHFAGMKIEENVGIIRQVHRLANGDLEK